MLPGPNSPISIRVNGVPLLPTVMYDVVEVVVDLKKDMPGMFTIRIQDREEIPHIFEELYRGANARGIEGSGLGLALVQRIVQLHNGQVKVRSHQDEPHGTVFTVRLPVKR